MDTLGLGGDRLAVLAERMQRVSCTDRCSALRKRAKSGEVAEASEPESTTAGGSAASDPLTTSSPVALPSPPAASASLRDPSSSPAEVLSSPPISPTLVEDSQPELVGKGLSRRESLLCQTASFEDLSDVAVVTKAVLR